MRRLLFLGVAAFSSITWAANDDGKLRTNDELFDFGVTVGVLNIEDFPAELVSGFNLSFRASEDFFLQYNLVQATVSESSFELNPAGAPLDLDDRKFTHYDLLLGYNIFQGEFFNEDEAAHLSNLYLVAGIGDTDFGGEKNFTYTLGVGYQIEFFRKVVVRFDYRDYVYRTSLILDEETVVHNNQFSAGVSYLF